MSEWVESPLGQIADLAIGGTPARHETRFWAIDGDEGLPWVSIADLRAGRVFETSETITRAGAMNSNVKEVPSGTILMSFKLTIGEVAIAERNLYTNEAIVAVSPKSPDIDKRFLFHTLPTAAKASVAETAIKGATLNKKKLATIPIRHHPNVNAQAKVASVLDAIDSQIEATEALIAKQERLRAGLMRDLFTRGVDENDELRPARDEAPQLYHETELGWLPKGWAAKSVSDCVDSISDGPFGSNLKSEHYVTEPGVRVIRLQNIQTGFFDATDQAFVSDDHARYLARFEVRPNDVLIASLGDDRFEAGRACLYPDGLGPAINKADCFRARAAQDVVSPYFLMCALNSEHARKGKLRLVQGVTRQRINTGNYRALVLPIPDPRSNEQSQIVRLLQKAEVAQNEALDALLELRRLKSGLMQDLLTGMVSVEPLLEKEPA
ncbi:MAG: restriction endonuclease subunit S [Pseudomonadota bacterium]|nr:restriction endonuclease subunit S [Pseudomonadota bacterium]